MKKTVFTVVFVCLFYFSSSKKAKDTVLVTTNFVADVVQKIGGEEIEVVTMMKAGVDPHLFKPTAGDLRRILKAKLIFYNGLFLESKFSEVLEKMQNKAFAITATIPEKDLLFFNNQTSIPDPHVWFDPHLWSYAFEYVAEILIKHYPEKRAFFEKRKQGNIEKLKNLDDWIQKELAVIPSESRILITAHDAFEYFTKKYQFELMGLQGINTQTEMSLTHLNDVVNVILERKIKAVFVENTISPKTIQALVEAVQAKGHPLKIGGKLYSDSLDEPNTPNGEYFGALKHNVNTIAKALK